MTATARIVLVEDDPGVADLVTLYLRNAGFFVVHAPTAADARRAFEEAKPALVVLDLGLPDGDGRDLFRELPGGIGRGRLPIRVPGGHRL